MIENLTLSVTDVCNSRCTMCNQWQTMTADDLKSEELDALFLRPEFAGTEYLNLTGGEPFLRRDIRAITQTILGRLRKVSTLFVSTNGTMPKKTAEYTTGLTEQYEDLDINITVSIDGDRDLNRQVRGIDSHEAAIATLNLCRQVSERVKTMVSSTLTPVNCSAENLQYLKDLANKTGSTFSFRMAAENNFYRNGGLNLRFSDKQLAEIVNFSRNFCAENPFVAAQADFFETGRMPIMGSPGDLKCKAGETFVFIDSRGDVFPCINSSRKIGDKNQGIFMSTIDDLGAHEQCVCCTECTFYPMLYAKDK